MKNFDSNLQLQKKSIYLDLEQKKMNKQTLSTLGAKLYNVSPILFTDWYWQQKNLAYSIQEVEKIIVDENDEKLDYILTEEKLIKVNNK